MNQEAVHWKEPSHFGPFFSFTETFDPAQRIASWHNVFLVTAEELVQGAAMFGFSFTEGEPFRSAFFCMSTAPWNNIHSGEYSSETALAGVGRVLIAAVLQACLQYVPAGEEEAPFICGHSTEEALTVYQGLSIKEGPSPANFTFCRRSAFPFVEQMIAKYGIS
ncbi:MAG: hypothetical protein WC901_04860 [Candidatus Margulisiibacteriota bacterium]